MDSSTSLKMEDSRNLQTSLQSRHLDRHNLAALQVRSQRWHAPPALDLQNQLSASSKSSASPGSSISLNSPTLAAVRQYYKDTGLQSALQECYSHERWPSVKTSADFPRRHSLFPPGALASRMETFNVSTPISLNRSPDVKSLAAASRQMLLSGVNSSELARLGSVVTRRKSVLQPTSGKVPSEYTHEKLRRWGSIYLGNPDSADAYIKAVHLRKPQTTSDDRVEEAESHLESQAESHSELPSDASEKEGEGNHAYLFQNLEEIVVRARVIPRAKERKPFLIQRRFNLQEMGANAAGSKLKVQGNDDVDSKSDIVVVSRLEEPNPQAAQLRSKRISSPVRTPLPDTRKTVACSARRGSASDRRIMPIHVEYALHYLPILAALMLSGHVRKGDAIDLPIPHPEAWRETVSYIYTGKGEVTVWVKENILYLAGTVD